MSSSNAISDKRFDVILKTLDSCQYINDELTKVEQLSSSINDDYLSKLITTAGELNLNLNITAFQDQEYNKLLSACPQLESIINIPVRLSECIYDIARFQEAIELLELVEQYHKSYGHTISIVEVIYKQTEKLREYLVNNLCGKLEHLKDSTHNDAMVIVNYLSRCGNLTDRELRLKYLQARDNWFNNACEEQGSSFDNVVSIYCKGLPMIFNEYKSIFTSESRKVVDNRLFRISSVDSSLENGAIINSWLLMKVSTFIASLDIYLGTVHQSGAQTPSMISDTMQKCFELTKALSSIGFDFSSQLKPLFYKTLVEELKSSIDKATTKFEIAFTTAVSKSVESLLLPVDDVILRISNINKPEELLPKSIDHYPVFKVYCLHIIDSLRWLQTTMHILSPTNLCLVTYGALNASLTRVMQALSTILNMDNNSNHPILTKIAITFITEILPFIASYSERLFPEKIILNAIGLSKSDFRQMYVNEPEKLKNFRLDLRQIADPLRGTMPSLLDTIEY